VLEAVTRGAAPAGLLSRVQSAWPEAAGAAVAEEAQPVSERDGMVTVACASATWAHELELLGGDLLPRLNAVLAGVETGVPVRDLRFVVRDP
jgi:predicted nucleic acid-binding Zn ribbon protein